MGYQLGIDLGTTYTAAAVCRSSDRCWVEPEVVTLGSRSATVPSVLFVAPDGSVVVGEAAERRALTDPDRVVREFKRRIGDPTPVVVAGRSWAPEELSARVVRWVVDRVAEREGGPASRIALTHPASWGQHKKELLAAALGAQGVTVTFLAEPQAAALHYAAAERVPAGATIAVYDLGGGTFDAAVVRKADPSATAFGAEGFGLLGRPEGLDRLGGVDFDEVVFEHVQAGLPAAFADLDDADPEVLSAVARVRRECTEAKEALSADTDVSIPVLMPAARGSVRLHRTEFEGLIRARVEDTVDALRTAVRSAGCKPDQLTAVLLVGGSSRIPLVAQLVSEQLGRPVAVDADPKNAIAKGAALAVSPKPTASWPEVAIPPVPALVAAAVPVGAAVAAEQMRAPLAAPPRPPLTPALSPPRGIEVVGRQAPVRLSHESPTTLLAGVAPEPPPLRPSVRPAPSPDWEYEAEPAPRRRPVGLLVGVGGVVAALVVAAVVLLARPGSSPFDIIGVDPASGGTSVAPSAPGSAGPGAPAPANPGGGSGGSPSGGGAAGGGAAPVKPGVPTKPGAGVVPATPSVPAGTSAAPAPPPVPAPTSASPTPAPPVSTAPTPPTGTDTGTTGPGAEGGGSTTPPASTPGSTGGTGTNTPVGTGDGPVIAAPDPVTPAPAPATAASPA